MSPVLDNVPALVFVLLGVAAVLSPLRWESFRFSPFMERAYWSGVARRERRSVRWGGLFLAFGAGMLTMAVITGHQLQPWHWSVVFWGAMTHVGNRVRVQNIDRLLEREANRPLEEQPRSRLTARG